MTDTETNLPDFRDLPTRDVVVYGDLNCPFCFALHERLFAWNLLDRVEWRLIVHAPDLEASIFSLEDQSLLANEVFSIHHRAPDVPVNLPKTRPGSEKATRFMQALDRLPVDHQVKARVALYRALWVDGRDIADPDTLKDVVAGVGLSEVMESADIRGDQNVPSASQETSRDNSSQSSELTVQDFWKASNEELDKFDIWQREWETSEEFDRRIPIIKRCSNDNLLLGLPTEQALVDFLKGSRTFYVNDDVCVFQPRPIALVFGYLEKLWPLVNTIRDSCEVLHFSNSDDCREMLSEHESVDFLLIEYELASAKDFDLLSDMASARDVTCIVVSAEGSDEAEMRALESGAAEYLPLGRSGRILGARFEKLVKERRKRLSMEQHAKFDALTQVPNRREFQARAEQEWHRLMHEGGGYCALLLIDIDFFKAYNDTYGHLGGDACLKRVASVLRSNARGYEDFIARYGGEEFVLLLPGATLESAREIGERLREAVIAEQIEHTGSSIERGHVTVSIGGTSAPATTGKTPGDLIRVADECLYKAKASGRNAVITQ